MQPEQSNAKSPALITIETTMFRPSPQALLDFSNIKKRRTFESPSHSAPKKRNSTSRWDSECLLSEMTASTKVIAEVNRIMTSKRLTSFEKLMVVKWIMQLSLFNRDITKDAYCKQHIDW